MKSIVNTKYYEITMIKPILFMLSIFLLFISIDSKSYEYQNEDYHVIAWCNKGQVEYRNQDGTRTDCLTRTHAIEFDFARKYSEAIGQALHYGIQNDRLPGIVLIITKQNDIKYYNRAKEIIKNYGLPITLWKMEAIYK